MTSGISKVAAARRIGGNLYDVTYAGGSCMDREVGYSYLRLLARRGYRVTVDQRGHHAPGEPETYEVARD